MKSIIKEALVEMGITLAIVGAFEVIAFAVEEINKKNRKKKEEEKLKRSMGKLVIVPRRK